MGRDERNGHFNLSVDHGAHELPPSVAGEEPCEVKGSPRRVVQALGRETLNGEAFREGLDQDLQSDGLRRLDHALLYPHVMRLHPDPRHTFGLASEEVVDNLVVELTQSELNTHLGPPGGA